MSKIRSWFLYFYFTSAVVTFWMDKIISKSPSSERCTTTNISSSCSTLSRNTARIKSLHKCYQFSWSGTLRAFAHASSLDFIWIRVRAERNSSSWQRFSARARTLESTCLNISPFFLVQCYANSRRRILKRTEIEAIINIHLICTNGIIRCYNYRTYSKSLTSMS